jgi:hypothetical protein
MELITKYTTLDKQQVKQLKNILSAHGAGVAVADRTGLNIGTIKRAADERRVSIETITKIQTFLKNHLLCK